MRKRRHDPGARFRLPAVVSLLLEMHVLNDFLAMGGYGFYVWGAYGVTALVLAAELASLRARRRRALAVARAGEADAPAEATFREVTR